MSALDGLARRARWGLSPIHRLRHHRWPYWVLVVALVVVTVWVVADLGEAARRERDAWGERRTVLVARHRLDPGTSVTDADVRRRELPVVAIPPDALDELGPDQRVTTTVHEGEVLLAARLDTTASTLPPGRAAVAVAIGPGSPPLEAGDRVQLWAVLDPLAGGPAEAVTRDAVVLEADADRALVAVAEADLGATTLALATSAVTVALVR